MRAFPVLLRTDIHRRSWQLALLTLVMLGALAFPGAQLVRAEGFDPAVRVSVPVNEPLTATLKATVSADFPEDSYDVRIGAHLQVGNRDLGSLGDVLARATYKTSSVVFSVPDSVRSKASAYVRATRHTRGIVVFTVASPTLETSTQKAAVSLKAPVVPQGPSRLSISGSFGSFVGDLNHRAAGAFLLRTPAGWLRTSAQGSRFATFTGIQVSDGCTADVVAQSQLFVAKSVDSWAAISGLKAGVVSSGRTRSIEWRILTTFPLNPYPGALTYSADEIASNHYAAVRLIVVFAPECGADAAREPRLLSQLRYFASHITANLTYGRKTH